MSTAKTYLRIQLTMFVFGIVGPISLVIYFSIQPEPTVRWMYWWGLFITFADVFIALALTQSAMGAESAPERRRRRNPLQDNDSDG
jgi:hypothetical protein